MSRAEHRAEAERLLGLARRGADYSAPEVTVWLRAAHVHALLALEPEPGAVLDSPAPVA